MHQIDGLYRHLLTGQLARYRGTSWTLVGNGALGYDNTNVFLANSEFDLGRVDIPKEMVPNVMLGIAVGKPFETVNGSQVFCIAKHRDGEFEMTVIKGGHGLGVEFRGHGPGSSYMVKPDGHPRAFNGVPSPGCDMGGAPLRPFDCMRIAKPGKPFRVHDELSLALSQGIAEVAAKRGY